MTMHDPARSLNTRLTPNLDVTVRKYGLGKRSVMRLSTRLQVSQSFAFLIAIAIVALAVFGFIATTERKSWQERQKEAVLAAGQKVSSLIERAEDTLLAGGIIAKSGDSGFRVSALLARNPALMETIYLDGDGVILQSAYSDASLLSSLYTLTQSTWFIVARGGQSYLSRLQFSAEEQPYLILSRPTDSGGVAAGRLNMSILRDVIAGIQFGKTGIAYLIDQEGQILAHPNYEIIRNGTTLAGRPELNSLISNNAGDRTYSYVNFQGKSVVAASAKIPLATDWWLVTEISEDEAYETSRLALLLLTLIVVAFWALVLLVNRRFLSAFLFRPLYRLRQATEAVEQGSLNVQVPIERADELGQVTQIFNEMVNRLAKREREREELITSLKTANQLAQESIRLKSEFLSTMSHELRTPLNAITGYTSIILEGMGGEVDDEAREMLERVFSNSEHLLSLINQVLDLAKIEAGRLELVSRPFSPRQQAERWQSQVAVLASNKNLSLEVTVSPEMPEILYGDIERLTQIAVNLLSNAIKFTERGTVRMALASTQDKWTITVTDTGIGIPPHALNLIFEEFRQVDSTSTRAHGGSGLGLAIVRNLCRMMNGKVEVTSKLGEGSTFTITLPIIVKSEVAATALSPAIVVR